MTSRLLIAILLIVGASASAQAADDVLKNGLRVRLVPNHDEKKVSVLLGVRAGFFSEPAGMPHLAHVAEHLTVFDAKPGSDEAQALQRWFEGGKANAETLADLMYFDIDSVEPSELELALRVQAGRLARADFDQAALEREIPRALSEVDFLERSEQASTAKFAVIGFVQAALHDQKEVLIRSQSKKITLKDVRAFHEANFRPDRAELVVIGDFDPAQIRPAIDKALGAIPKPNGDVPNRPAPPKPGTLVAKWDVSTTNLVIAWPTPPASDADYPALALATYLLNQKMFLDPVLREKAKLPYASNDAEGFFLINLQARNPADLQSLRERVMSLVQELGQSQGMLDSQVPLMAANVAQMLGPLDLKQFPLPPNVSKLMALANLEIQKMLKSLVVGDLPGYAKRLGGVTAPAVRKAVTKHLDPKRAIVVRLEPMK